MGAVQARQNNTNLAFIRQALPLALVKDSETFLTDAARSGDIAKYTLVSKIGTKWVPFTDETATDGSQLPLGILLQTITEAAIKAADVVGVVVLVGGALFDEGLLVIENSKLLTTVITVPTNLKLSVEDFLAMRNLYPTLSVDIDGFENA